MANCSRVRDRTRSRTSSGGSASTAGSITAQSRASSWLVPRRSVPVVAPPSTRVQATRSDTARTHLPAPSACAARGGVVEFAAMRLFLLLAAVALAVPASAAAAPPPNDHYLASTTINRQDGSLARQYEDTVDTTEATTQPDVFDPNREGLPFGGGDPEPTSCGGASSYGRTAWWDFRPPTTGGVQIRAN